MIGFPVVFILAWLARVLAGNGLFIDYGIEYVIFALLLGLLISNTIGTPAWLKPAAQTEFYIKTGLVILGAGLLFMEVIQAGALGILQAVLVVLVIWYFCFWLARKLRVDDDFAAMLSSSVAICGVSAAIATCGAIQGDKKKLSYVTSLVLIVAVPMMIVMPWIAKSFQMNDIVAGAWLGGTLDTSATVVAAGALISDVAMKTGVIVKLSQNALIGVAAFILVVWWAYKAGKQQGADKPSAGIIWERFPKFVLGFLVASALFSFFLPAPMVEGTRSVLSRAAHLVVRARLRLHRPRDQVRRPRHDGRRAAGAGVPRRAGGERHLDPAPRLPDLRRRDLPGARYQIGCGWCGRSSARVHGRRSTLIGAAHFFPRHFRRELRRADARRAHRAARRPARRGRHAQGARRRARPGGSELLSRSRKRHHPCAARHLFRAARRAPLLRDLVFGRQEEWLEQELRALKPWAAFFGIWTRFRAREGWEHKLDLDAAQIAAELGKEVRYLETIEEQIAALEAVPVERFMHFLASGDWPATTRRTSATTSRATSRRSPPRRRLSDLLRAGDRAARRRACRAHGGRARAGGACVVIGVAHCPGVLARLRTGSGPFRGKGQDRSCRRSLALRSRLRSQPVFTLPRNTR